MLTDQRKSDGKVVPSLQTTGELLDKVSSTPNDNKDKLNIILGKI